MLWMETYLLYCSVRLGVVVVALLAFIQVYVPAALLLIMGMDAVDPIIKLLENDYEYGKSPFVRKQINWIENHVQAFIVLTVTMLTIHTLCCGLAIFGALKLKKWFLLPFIVTEFVRVIFCFASHIILMIILKKKLNLGLLITVTLAGGFAILYLGYNWATSVALYQIIELIHTERYRQLYGDDPFNPQLPPSYGTYTPPPLYGTVENVRVLTTPRSSDINQQKQAQGVSKFPRSRKQQPVIAVLPANYRNNNTQYQYNNLSQQKQYEQYQSQQNEFGNWQWSELMVGRQRKPVISRNW
ncbi:uncharacterized protein [Eurosta solidaginis]|uniref:uncharacterized protein n=1 Tax=Eurosta solidaginis TaxID=178769 RepID=UPI003530D82C